MGTQTIFEQFAALAGLEEKQAAGYWTLCDNARVQVEGIAKPETLADGEQILCATAAALAFYRWALLRAAMGEETSFAAGDVRVTTGRADVSMARQLWREAEAAAAPYLNDNGFVFERM